MTRTSEYYERGIRSFFLGYYEQAVADREPQPVDELPVDEPPAHHSSDYSRMSECERLGINGDAANGCPLAGTDDCTCDS